MNKNSNLRIETHLKVEFISVLTLILFIRLENCDVL